MTLQRVLKYYIHKSVLDDFDLKYRTVDGVVCETRESADFSRSELPDILEFMKQIQPLKSNPILPYENDLLAKKEKFNQHIFF